MGDGGTVTLKDQGWSKIVKSLGEMEGSYTKVGVQVGTMSNDGVSIAEYAFYNEFGTSRIPERPALRIAYDQNARSLWVTIGRLVDGVMAGKLNTLKALKILGEQHQGHIKHAIRDLREPENAPSTIKAKGSTNPLINTGAYMNSIRHEEVLNG